MHFLTKVGNRSTKKCIFQLLFSSTHGFRSESRYFKFYPDLLTTLHHVISTSALFVLHSSTICCTSPTCLSSIENYHSNFHSVQWRDFLYFWEKICLRCVVWNALPLSITSSPSLRVHLQKKASWFPQLIVWNVRLFDVFIVLPPYVKNNKSQYNVLTSLTVLTHLWGDLSV